MELVSQYLNEQMLQIEVPCNREKQSLASYSHLDYWSFLINHLAPLILTLAHNWWITLRLILCCLIAFLLPLASLYSFKNISSTTPMHIYWCISCLKTPCVVRFESASLWVWLIHICCICKQRLAGWAYRRFYSFAAVKSPSFTLTHFCVGRLGYISLQHETMFSDTSIFTPVMCSWFLEFRSL